MIDGTVLGEPEFFALELTAGDSVTLTVESNTFGFDPVVVLSFDSNELGFNDDAEDSGAVGDRFDSQLIIGTANSGVHEILVAGLQGGMGDFTLTVERS